MTALVRRARESEISVMAFGDLYLKDVRDYRVKMLEGTGIDPVFPIWIEEKEEAKRLALEMVANDVRAVLATIDPKQLDPKFAGRRFDRKLLDEFPATVDWCGENGEFHTLCVFGPAFSYPVEVKTGASETHGGFVFTEIELDHHASPPPPSREKLHDLVVVHITRGASGGGNEEETISKGVRAVCGEGY